MLITRVDPMWTILVQKKVRIPQISSGWVGVKTSATQVPISIVQWWTSDPSTPGPLTLARTSAGSAMIASRAAERLCKYRVTWIRFLVAGFCIHESGCKTGRTTPKTMRVC